MIIYKHLCKLLSLLVIILFCLGCSQKSEIEKSVEQIDMVLDGIEDRCEVEDHIIIEETNSLKFLRSNLDSANSDGMREKIKREILLKESVIEKSKNNRQNQEKILEELRLKRDSLVEIQKNK